MVVLAAELALTGNTVVIDHGCGMRKMCIRDSSYTEAIECLKKNNKKFQFPVEWGVDIQTEYERLLFGEDDAAPVEPEAAADEAAPAEDAAE